MVLRCGTREVTVIYQLNLDVYVHCNLSCYSTNFSSLFVFYEKKDSIMFECIIISYYQVQLLAEHC
jgi:hypothetical protein